MVWIKDDSGNFTCSNCGNMVRDDGYGGIDYPKCPYCGASVGEDELAESENKI